MKVIFEIFAGLFALFVVIMLILLMLLVQNERNDTLEKAEHFATKYVMIKTKQEKELFLSYFTEHMRDLIIKQSQTVRIPQPQLIIQPKIEITEYYSIVVQATNYSTENIVNAIAMNAISNNLDVDFLDVTDKIVYYKVLGEKEFVIKHSEFVTKLKSK